MWERCVLSLLLVRGCGGAKFLKELHLANETIHSRAPPGSSRALNARLLAQHHKTAAPDGLVKVHYELEIVRILEVDELAQHAYLETLSALLYIKMDWVDDTLTWEPTEFGGLNETWLPYGEVWLPDIIVFNMKDESGCFEVSHDNLLSSVRGPVVVGNDGKVVYTYPAIYSVMCTIDVERFPIDLQSCEFDIASWDYNVRKLRLEADERYLLAHYQPNEEWSLNSASVSTELYTHEGIQVTEIIVRVVVERRPFFYMISLVFPSFCISLVAIIGLFSTFSSTGQREERFTMGGTAILSMTVLALIVTEKVPHSNGVPLMVQYFVAKLALIAAATLSTGFIMKAHRRGVSKKPPPPRWLLVALCLRGRAGRRDSLGPASTARTSSTSSEAWIINEQSGEKERRPKHGRERRHPLEELGESLAAINRRLHQDSAEDPSNGWIMVAKRLDFVCLTLFLLGVFLTTFYLVVETQMISISSREVDGALNEFRKK